MDDTCLLFLPLIDRFLVKDKGDGWSYFEVIVARRRRALNEGKRTAPCGGLAV